MLVRADDLLDLLGLTTSLNLGEVTHRVREVSASAFRGVEAHALRAFTDPHRLPAD